MKKLSALKSAWATARRHMHGRAMRVRGDEHVCFIISAPRSGSTWLKTALNQHPHVYCTENRLFGQFCEIWANGDGTRSPRITLDKYIAEFSQYYEVQSLDIPPREFVDQFLVEWLNFLFEFSLRYSGKSIIVDKVTPYLKTSPLVLKSIHRYLPRAKIVQLIRDGRDLATSGVFDWLRKDGPGSDRYAYFVEKRPAFELQRFFDDEKLELWSRLWTDPIDAIADMNPNVLNIHYEAMQRDQHAVLTQLLQHLGVNAASTVVAQCVEGSTFQRMSGGRDAGDELATAKVRKGIVGDWKNYFTRRDGEIFHNVAGQRLLQMGYEKTDDWIRQLPERLTLRPHP